MPVRKHIGSASGNERGGPGLTIKITTFRSSAMAMREALNAKKARSSPARQKAGSEQRIRQWRHGPSPLPHREKDRLINHPNVVRVRPICFWHRSSTGYIANNRMPIAPAVAASMTVRESVYVQSIRAMVRSVRLGASTKLICVKGRNDGLQLGDFNRRTGLSELPSRGPSPTAPLPGEAMTSGLPRIEHEHRDSTENRVRQLRGRFAVELGHCEIQLRTLGVKYGQYQISQKNILRT